jgi:phosphate transport system protein
MSVTRVIHLMTLCRCLERIGDHVTNIAEDVIFMLDALAIRHHADIKE